jgi:tetratricopeptide (TPR) repeat protein
VDLYAGPFLDGFYLPGLPEFERWLESERSRLATDFADAVRALALWAATDGQYDQEVHWFRILVSHDRLNDTYAMGLVRALASAGDVAAAIKYARTHTALVKQELDVEPAAEFQHAVEQLRQGRPMPKRMPSRLSLRPPTPPAPMPAFVSASSRIALPDDLAIAPRLEEAPFTSSDSSRTVQQRTSGSRRPDSPLIGRHEPIGARGVAPIPHLSAIIAAVLLASLVVFPSAWLVRRTAPSAPVAHGISAVVLPFTVTGDAKGAGLGSSVAELLATSLDGSLGLHAVAANAATAEAPPRDSSRGESYALAAEILASGFGGAGGNARVASVTTSSLDAAKAYLGTEVEFRAGRFRGAIDGYQEAIRLDSGFALAQFGLSEAAEMEGDNQLVHLALGYALRNAARLPNRQKRLLTAYLSRQRGDVDHAEQLYSQIAADYPSDASAWMGLGEALFHLNPLRGRAGTDARQAFEHVMMLDPTNTNSRVHLARIAALLGQDDGARRNIELARRLAPDDVIGRYALHVLSLGGPNLEAGVARDRLERAAADLPDRPQSTCSRDPETVPWTGSPGSSHNATSRPTCARTASGCWHSPQWGAARSAPR